MNRKLLIRKIVNYLLLIFTIIYIITGLGVSEHRIIESITISLLTKPISHQIHSNLIIPFVILLIIHVYLSIRPKFFKKLLGKK